MAGERLDHGAAHEVVRGELDAARQRQPAGVERRVIIVEPLQVLVVRRPDAPDGGDAAADQVAFRVRRVTLEVALQPTLALRER